MSGDALDAMLEDCPQVETKTTTKMFQVCKVCGEKFFPNHVALEHAFEKHMEPVVRVEVDERAVYKFTSREQAEAWKRVRIGGWAVVHWAEPGWYTAALDPETDNDGDACASYWPIAHVIEELEARITADRLEVYGMRVLP